MTRDGVLIQSSDTKNDADLRVDGGSVTAPRWAIYGTHGEWEVEDIGIQPDIEVAQEPALVREGHDPQLEAAVLEALSLLQEHPLPKFPAPAAPDKHQVLPWQ